MKEAAPIFSRAVALDYRNAKYQGLLRRDSSKRDEFGIVIDDDLTFCFSEWDNGLLNGSTLFHFADGSYMYGSWKNNQPHGFVCFRNSHFLLFTNFVSGKPIGETIAISNSLNHIYILESENILTKQHKLKISSFEEISQIATLDEIVANYSQNCQIRMAPYERSLLRFLENIEQRHSGELSLIETDGKYYFGFQNGLGMRFSVKNKQPHKLHIASIGTHEKQKLVEFGAKNYENRCIEEGNFLLKETITYNRRAERPRQKTLSIFQKMHKKSLFFVNQYFEYPTSLIYLLETLLNDKLATAAQRALQYRFQNQRSKPEDRNHRISESRQRYYEEIKEELRKKSESMAKKANSKRTPTKSIKIVQESESALKKALKPIYAKFAPSKSPLKQSPMKPSKSATNIAILKTESKQKQKFNVVSPPKKAVKQPIKHQIPTKHEINAKAQPDVTFLAIADSPKKQRSKSIANLARTISKEESRYRNQLSNELKIREEILQKSPSHNIDYLISDNYVQDPYFYEPYNPKEELYKIAYPSRPTGGHFPEDRLNEINVEERRLRLLSQFRNLNRGEGSGRELENIPPQLVRNYRKQEIERQISSFRVQNQAEGRNFFPRMQPPVGKYEVRNSPRRTRYEYYFDNS